MRESKNAVVKKLLSRYGRTFGDELHIRVDDNTPSALFRLLTFALLSSARIGHGTAMNAARALADQGWTTAQKMAEATWRERTDVLNHSGYARYDESTSRMLGETAAMILEQYAGDLRKLREAAGRDPKAERKRLKQFKGLGDVGVDIFFREVQAAWDELMPFADARALKAAEHLELGRSASDLAELVAPKDFTRLVTGLARVELEKKYAELESAASAEASP